MAGPKVRDALDAAIAASKWLEGRGANPARGLALIAPYSECDEFVDAEPGQARRVRAIVCAVVGDCHRTLGEVEAAVGWYARARGYCEAGGGPPFFAPFYAAMVVDHRLSGHYRAALECLRASRANWRSRSLLTRVYWDVVSLWWVRPGQWRMRLRERRLVGELEALVQHGG